MKDKILLLKSPIEEVKQHIVEMSEKDLNNFLNIRTRNLSFSQAEIFEAGVKSLWYHLQNL